MTAPEILYLTHRAAIEEVLRAVIRRNHLSPDDAEEFAARVRLRLVETNYEALRRFEGRSSLRTYLAVVIHRLLLDYRTERWGKWRPSAFARRAGPAAVRLEQLMARDGRTFDDACAIVEREFPGESRALLETVSARIALRTRRSFEGADVLEDIAADEPSIEAMLIAGDEEAHRARVCKRLGALLTTLTDEDRLLLQLRFEQGLTVAEIARVRGMDQKGLYRRIDQVIARLRDALAKEQLSEGYMRERTGRA